MVLPLSAQGNIIADMLATQAHGRLPEWPIKPLPGEPWQCSVDGNQWGGNLLRHVNEYIIKERVQTKWVQVFGLHEDQAQLCDWDIFYRIWEHKTRDRCIWWTKFSTRVHVIGRNLLRRNHMGTSKCPCCGEEETPTHLLKCTHDQIQGLYEKFHKGFIWQMTGVIGTDMVLGICTIMKGFRTGLIAYQPQLEGEFFQFLVRQFWLGQGAFLAGLWLQCWHDFHVRHSKPSGI